ncbi:MAG: hypothetical protein AAF826_05590, partial [Pseudomonadota bacterium]
MTKLFQALCATIVLFGLAGCFTAYERAFAPANGASLFGNSAEVFDQGVPYKIFYTSGDYRIEGHESY